MPHYDLKVLDQNIVDCLDRHEIVDVSASEFTCYEVLSMVCNDPEVHKITSAKDVKFDWGPVISGEQKCPDPYQDVIDLLDSWSEKEIDALRARLFAIVDERQANRGRSERNAARQ